MTLHERLTRDLNARSQRTLLLAGLTGVLTGLGVAAFDWVTRDQILNRVIEAPVGVQAAAIVGGLLIAAASLAWIAGGATPASADEYIRNFHQPDRPLSMRPAIGRIIAGAATLGGGGAMGFEGPSLYIGAILGTAIQARWSRLFSREDSKVLMVAGAAAGVAAIFKAPATGAVFALEVPFRDDTARRMLLPSLIGAATGYLTLVLILGTEPLFQIGGTPPFDVKELGGAVILGLVCGLGARGFAMMIRYAKGLSVKGHPVVRALSAGAILVALLLLSNLIYGESLATGSGYRTLEWVTQPQSFWLIVALLVFRLTATSATLGGGGVGGLFVPLVVAGSLVGAATSNALGDTTTLFPLIGVAAFLGAGYRTPLAGVMFVAETTGRPGFVVPGLIASVAAQLVMGNASVSPYQAARRTGHLERRFRLPISAALTSDVRTVPSDATLDEFYQHHLLMTRYINVPVVDENTYRGMVTVFDVQALPPEKWPDTTVGELIREDWPAGSPDWNLERAVRTMEAADVDVLPVIDESDAFIGVVTTSDVLRLDEILGGPPTQ